MTLDANKLSAAKLWLISARDASAPGGNAGTEPRGLPYLAHALYALVPVESFDVERATCDEYWRVYINPGWFDRSAVPEIGRELAHLVWHLLSDHANRARTVGVDRATARAWTDATDIAISHTLEGDDSRPEHLPTAAGCGLPGGRSAEEYFAQLSGLPAIADPDTDQQLEGFDGCGSGADAVPRASEYGPAADVGAVLEMEARSIRQRVAIEYSDHVRARGTDPGDARRWIREVLEPRTPWEQVLRSAVKRAAAWAAGLGDYTYSRPSRRAGSVRDVVMPGQHRPTPRIAVVVDTSGSVDDRLLTRALGEVDGVIRGSGVAGSGVTLYSVDAAAHVTKHLRSAHHAELVGAGGTDLRVGLSAIEAERPRPNVVVVLTDGDTPWPENPPPGAVVVIGLLGRSGQTLPPTPEWAVRVECLLEE